MALFFDERSASQSPTNRRAAHWGWLPSVGIARSAEAEERDECVERKLDKL
jgi:hypothetical protein